MNETISCHCGGTCLKLKKDEMFVFKDKKIIIRKVPYYKCGKCRKEFKIAIIKKTVKFIEQNFMEQVNNGIVNQTTECEFYTPILS